MDYEYVRNGTRKLLAVFDPHTGDVYAELRDTRKAEELIEFMDAVAELYPKKVINIVWDNLNKHHEGPDNRWTAFNARHGGRFRFHYTPIHASWVNQVEMFFGILHRRVLRYGVFNTICALDEAVIGFINHWQEHERHPFRCNFKGYSPKTAKLAA